MPLWFALTILAVIVALFGTCACILAARSDAPDDDARQITECKAVHLPFGATPEALTITNEGE